MPQGTDDEQVAEGWNRYLTETRDARAYDYDSIEVAAWDRLLAHLKAIGQPLVRKKGKVKV